MIKINYTIIFEIKKTCLSNISICWFCTWKLNKYKNAFFFHYRILVSKKIEKRWQIVQRKKEKYVTFEFNFIWFLNNHDKFKIYDIEIYAIVDAYFRYIIWIYVEISTRTVVSVLLQYLNIVEHMNFQSRFLRIDRNTKIVIMIEKHYILRKIKTSNLLLKKCYMYDINTLNVRIENW